MRKRLELTLDRLRSASNGRFRKPTSVRGGLQVPQQMQALSVPVRSRRAR